MFSKKATEIDEILTVNLTFTKIKCQREGEDFIIFCGLLRKHELYFAHNVKSLKKSDQPDLTIYSGQVLPNGHRQ